MANVVTSQSIRRARLQRLVLAFLIGLPTTMIFPFNVITTPIWWWPEIPFMVLLLALWLSILRDPRVMQGEIAGKRLRNSLITTALLIVTFFISELVLLRLTPIFVTIGEVIVCLMVGLTAAFAVGSQRSKANAYWFGLMAWLGAATANMVATYIDVQAIAHNPDFIKHASSYVGGLLIFSFFAHLTGLAIAAVGAELGWRLNRTLLGEPRNDFEPAKKR